MNVVKSDQWSALRGRFKSIFKRDIADFWGLTGFSITEFAIAFYPNFYQMNGSLDELVTRDYGEVGASLIHELIGLDLVALLSPGCPCKYFIPRPGDSGLCYFLVADSCQLPSNHLDRLVDHAKAYFTRRRWARKHHVEADLPANALALNPIIHECLDHERKYRLLAAVRPDRDGSQLGRHHGD